MNPILGIIFHAIGGAAAGSFYAPCKRVKGWSWETYWLILGVFAWIVAPVLMATIIMPNFLEVFKAVPTKVLFWGGGCDSQHVLSFATPEEVDADAKKYIEIFKVGGGYVFNNVHNIQGGVPAENIVALMDAGYKYGFYNK